ncbi:MAG: hypothetical protein ACE5JG_09930 [Planctomycetota bacterium]
MDRSRLLLLVLFAAAGTLAAGLLVSSRDERGARRTGLSGEVEHDVPEEEGEGVAGAPAGTGGPGHRGAGGRGGPRPGVPRAAGAPTAGGRWPARWSARPRSSSRRSARRTG